MTKKQKLHRITVTIVNNTMGTGFSFGDEADPDQPLSLKALDERFGLYLRRIYSQIDRAEEYSKVRKEVFGNVDRPTDQDIISWAIDYGDWDEMRGALWGANEEEKTIAYFEEENK